MKTTSKKPQPKITLEQFNKEKGIATITSFKVIDNTPKHTQGEWKYKRDTENSLKIFSTDSDYIAEIVWDEITEEKNLQKWNEAEANAQRIVKAVNMHDELIDLARLVKVAFQHEITYSKESMGGRMREQAIELLKQAEQK